MPPKELYGSQVAGSAIDQGTGQGGYSRQCLLKGSVPLNKAHHGKLSFRRCFLENFSHLRAPSS
jgi:hypothetical protein